MSHTDVIHLLALSKLTLRSADKVIGHASPPTKVFTVTVIVGSMGGAADSVSSEKCRAEPASESLCRVLPTMGSRLEA
jgi:hypothetical protein